MPSIRYNLTHLENIPREHQEAVYNGIDSCVTIELFNILQSYLNQHTSLTYQFEQAMLGPALTAMFRGISVDFAERDRIIRQFEAEENFLQKAINIMSQEMWGDDFNPRSSHQKKEFFYDCCNLPKQYKYANGERTLTCNEETLRKFAEAYPVLSLFIELILEAEGARKMLSVARSEIDEDGRLRFSMNIGGTKTGRNSSSASPFGTGTNSQNLTERIRRMCVADPGKVLCYTDYAGAESVVVGAISGDKSYLAHALDPNVKIHARIARGVWENDYDWGDDPRGWRRVAENNTINGRTLYYLGKRGGHLTNYLGQPKRLSEVLGIPYEVAKHFQHAYLYKLYPGIRRWQNRVIEKGQVEGQLITVLGRPRQFFGRRDDPASFREWIAHEPQSVIGDLNNLGSWRVWNALDLPGTREVEILNLVHDALLWQCDEDKLQDLIPKVHSLMEVEINFPLVGPITVPVESKWGWCWEEKTEQNAGECPDGLVKWTNKVDRTRSKQKVVDTAVLRPDLWDGDTPTFQEMERYFSC